MESQMTLQEGLQSPKNGKLVQKKPFLCGAEVILKYKFKISGKAGEMAVLFLESLAASCQVILFIFYISQSY